jgi:hypothetical protein
MEMVFNKKNKEGDQNLKGEECNCILLGVFLSTRRANGLHTFGRCKSYMDGFYEKIFTWSPDRTPVAIQFRHPFEITVIFWKITESK